MISKINKMIKHDNEYISKIGWFLYDKNNGENGLSKDEIEELIDLIVKVGDEENNACDECPYAY